MKKLVAMYSIFILLLSNFGVQFLVSKAMAAGCCERIWIKGKCGYDSGALICHLDDISTIVGYCNDVSSADECKKSDLCKDLIDGATCTGEDTANFHDGHECIDKHCIKTDERGYCCVNAGSGCFPVDTAACAIYQGTHYNKFKDCEDKCKITPGPGPEPVPSDESILPTGQGPAP